MTYHCALDTFYLQFYSIKNYIIEVSIPYVVLNYKPIK